VIILEQEVKKKQPGWVCLLILEVVTLGGAGIIGLLIRNDIAVYETLNKPIFAPPGWLFPIVWTILYALMALSIWLVLRTDSSSRMKLLTLSIVQWLVNLVWPILFFMQRAWGLSFVWLLLLEALVIILMTGSFRASRSAGWLLVPYAAWVAFAGVLNCLIALWNP